MGNGQRQLGLIADLSGTSAQHEAALVQQLGRLLSNPSAMVRVQHRGEIGGVMRALAKEGCDVIALLGESGTVGAAMSDPLVRRADAPALLPLPTTIVSRLRGRWTRRRDSPVAALERALAARESGTGKRVLLSTLRVSSGLHPRALVGFDFLAGMGYRVLEDSARTRSGRGAMALAAAAKGARAGLRPLASKPLEGTLNDVLVALSDTCWATAWGASGRPEGTFSFATGGGSRWRRTAMMLAALARQPLPKMVAARRLVVALEGGFALDGEIVALAGSGTVTVESGPRVAFFEAP